jgi:hypothetical protein
MLEREASFAPATFDPADRTVEVVFTTGADVARRDPWSGERWTERLEVSVAAVDLSRLNAGAPVLDSHRAGELRNVIGVVERAWITGGEGRALIRFSDRPEVQPIVEDVRNGIIRNVSAGYWVEPDAWQEIEAAGNGPRIRVAKRWVPAELSLVPIPADARAQVRAAPPAESPTTGRMAARTEEFSMREASPDVSAAESPPAQPPATLADLQALAARAGLDADFVVAQLAARATTEAAREAAIENLAARRAPAQTPWAGVGHSWDSPASVVERAAEALAARATGRPVSDPARQFAGLPVHALARQVLMARGERLAPHEPPAEVIRRAISTSDFPLMLGSSMQRVLQERLVAAPGAARIICRMRETPDFREGKFVQFASIGSLKALPEGGPIENAAPAERGESYAVKTWARASRWTRQALVNDDLGVLDQMMLFANAVVATEAEAFVEMFAANGAGWGPTLTDGNPLFHSTHANVGAGAVGTTGIAAGRLVMRGQKDAIGNLVAPEPRILLAGPAGETAAEQALNATAIAVAEGARPVFANRLQLAIEPRLAGAPWFMFADPAQAPVLAMVTLAGSGAQPRITQHESEAVDGIAWKITHDFVIAPMSFVGAVRLTGA